MNKMDVRKPSLWVFLAFLTVLGGTWVGTWHWVGDPTAWFRPADDAYYYFQVAENLGKGHGPTMDKLNDTNGFHPLWLALLVPFFGLAEDPTSTGIVLTQLLILVLLAASAVILFRLLAERFSLTTALLGVSALAFPEYRNVAMAGVEGAIALPLFLLVARELIHRPERLELPVSRNDAQLGFLLALTMLARLDAVFLLFVISGILCVRAWRDSSPSLTNKVANVWSKGIAVFWPVLILVLPYLIWNEVRFGHVVPISGLLKSTFPAPDPTWSYLHKHWEYVMLLAMASGGWMLGRIRGPWKDPFRTAVGALIAGALLHLLYTLLFMDGVFWWHYVSYISAGLLGVGFLAEPMVARSPTMVQRMSVVAAVLLMVAAIVVSMTRRLPDGQLAIESGTRLATRRAADWVRNNLPEDAILGMKDSGAVTFYSRRRVVNLDGVINNLEYQRRKCTGEFEAYLHEVGVDYIVQHRVPLEDISGNYKGYVQSYPCLLEKGQGGRLTFSQKDEVFRTEPYWSGSIYGPAVIWKLEDQKARSISTASPP